MTACGVAARAKGTTAPRRRSFVPSAVRGIAYARAVPSQVTVEGKGCLVWTCVVLQRDTASQAFRSCEVTFRTFTELRITDRMF